jgi:hypothetical protein
MDERPKVKISRLREIGWSLWDPIGLREISDGEWQDGGACAGEYDGYLLQAAARLLRGDPAAEVVGYLEEAETGYIGMTRNATTRQRAEGAVVAIQAYLATLPAGQRSVR